MKIRVEDIGRIWSSTLTRRLVVQSIRLIASMGDNYEFYEQTILQALSEKTLDQNCLFTDRYFKSLRLTNDEALEIAFASCTSFS